MMNFDLLQNGIIYLYNYVNSLPKIPQIFVIAVAFGFIGAFNVYINLKIKDFLVKIFKQRRDMLESSEEYSKLDAKKHNEHLKLIASFCNTVGAAILGAAFIVPYIGNHASPDQVDARWVLAGLALPLAGHIALRFMKSEG